MNSKKLARRDDLAREHKLGKLELQRAAMSFKRWVLITGGSMLGFYAILAVIVFLAQAHSANAGSGTENSANIFDVMIGMLFIVCVPLLLWFSFYYMLNNTTISLYTRGIVSLSVNKEKVALWKDISWVQTVRGVRGSTYRVIHLSDGTRIRLTNLPARGSASFDALEKFIQQKRGF